MSFDEYDGPPGRSQHVFHDDIAPTGNTMLRSSLNARQLGLIEANLHDFDWMSDGTTRFQMDRDPDPFPRDSTAARRASMRNLKLTIAYDGTDFSGWQIQPDRPSIQGAIAEAFFQLTAERATVNAAGRTDAGVHALGQVANIRTQTRLPIERLLLGLQHYLPDAIAIREICDVPEAFHATLSARQKTYRYVLRTSRLRDPFSRRYAWRISHPLDVGAMSRAAGMLVGTHDFKCFETQGSPRADTVRTLFQVGVYRAGDWPVMSAATAPVGTEEGPYVVIEVTGDGFLYNMVRAISGTLVEVGLGKRSAEGVHALIGQGQRAAAGQTAPAHGLFLVNVEYGEA